MVRNERKRTIRLAILVGAIAVLAACINPFSSSSSGDGGGEAAAGNGGTQLGSLVINPGGGVGASTVAPDLDLISQISTYNVTLTNESPGGVAPITVNGYVVGDPINGIFPGTWELSVAGLNGSGQTIATGVPTSGNPITVTAGGTANVAVELAPAQSATGELAVTLSWGAAFAPGIDVDQVSVTLYSYTNTVGETLTATASSTQSFTNSLVTTTGTVDVNFSARTVTVGDTSLNSGFYLLTMQLYEGTGAGAVEYAPVIEAVQIYDYLQSIKSINLELGDLTNAPDAPTGLAATLTGDNQFSLSWTDSSNTEEGFNIYLGTVGGAPAATVPAGTESASSALLNYLGDAGNALTYYVTAYNQYGESAATSRTFTAIGGGGPYFDTGVHSNSADWAAPGDPGDLVWGAFPGAESYVVHVSQSAADVVNLNAPVSGALTGTSFDLAAAGPYGPGTYYWLVEARNDSTQGSFAEPMESFTIRNRLYVETSGANGAPGSNTLPLSRITEAVSIAESGETILVSPGTYDGQLTIDKTLTIEGSTGSPPIIQHTLGSGLLAETIVQTAGDLELRDLEVRGPEFSPLEPSNQIGIAVGGTAQSIALDNVDIFNTQGDNAYGVIVETDAAVTMQSGSITAFPHALPGDEAFGIYVVAGHTRNSSIVVNGVNFVMHDSDYRRRAIAVDATPGAGELSVAEFSVFDLGIADHNLDRSYAIRSTIPTTVQDTIIRMGASNAFLSAIEVPGGSAVRNSRIEITDVAGVGDESHVVRIPPSGAGIAGIYNNVMAVRPTGGGSFDFVQTDRHTEVVHNTMVAYEANSDWKGVERIGGDIIVMRNNIVQSFSPSFGQGFFAPVAGGMEVRGNVFYRNKSFYYGGAVYSNVHVFNVGTPSSIDLNVETTPMLASGGNVLGNPFEWLRTTPLAGYNVVATGSQWAAAPGDIDGDLRSAPTTVGAYELTESAGVVGLVGEWLSVQPTPSYDSSGTPGIAANGLGLYHSPGINVVPGRYGNAGALTVNRVVLQNAGSSPTATTYPELATASNGFSFSLWFMAPDAVALANGGVMYEHSGPNMHLSFVMTGNGAFTLFLDDGVNGFASAAFSTSALLSAGRWYQLFLVGDGAADRWSLYISEEGDPFYEELFQVGIANFDFPTFLGSLADTQNIIRWGGAGSALRVDDMRYFNVPLTTGEIDAMIEHEY